MLSKYVEFRGKIQKYWGYSTDYLPDHCPIKRDSRYVLQNAAYSIPKREQELLLQVTGRYGNKRHLQQKKKHQQCFKSQISCHQWQQQQHWRDCFSFIWIGIGGWHGSSISLSPEWISLLHRVLLFHPIKGELRFKISLWCVCNNRLILSFLSLDMKKSRLLQYIQISRDRGKTTTPCTSGFLELFPQKSSYPHMASQFKWYVRNMLVCETLKMSHFLPASTLGTHSKEVSSGLPTIKIQIWEKFYCQGL